MIDLHTHILPEIDDGAKDWGMAEQMCRMAMDDGIRHIVCTPHANDTYSYDRDRLLPLLEKLKNRLGARAELEFTLGCDFSFSYENIQQAATDPSRFLIGKTKYLLVELSDFTLSPAIAGTLVSFIARGITPVISHPERNLLMQQRPEQVAWFAQKGCVIQLTANSLTGFWGVGPKKMSYWLLEHGAAHVIASDAHNTTSRPPILSKARAEVAARFGEDVGRALVEDNPAAIVRDQALPYFPEPILR